MSQTYTTGDLAKLAGVSVRTVQYYDKRGILVPSQLSEGGRRIYSESDLEKLRLICFLRDLDFSIEQIKRLYAEENAKQVLELLLVEHIKAIKQQLAEKKDALDSVHGGALPCALYPRPVQNGKQRDHHLWRYRRRFCPHRRHQFRRYKRDTRTGADGGYMAKAYYQGL